MKNVLISICLVFTVFLTACGTGKDTALQTKESINRETTAVTAAEAESTEAVTGEMFTVQETEAAAEEAGELLAVNLSVGGRVFPAKLYDNAATRELAERMPMELEMSELHGNEKYYYLPEALPANSENPGDIHTGDIMLYGTDCLVVFYEDFQSSFSYTRLGYLENPAGFSEAVGSGSVTVTFESVENSR